MKRKEEIIYFKEHFGIDHIVCCYSEQGVQQLSNILTYRIEHAQYELWQEECEDLTWEEYLYYLSQSPKMREKARCTALHAQRNLPAEQFDFTHPKPEADGELTPIIRLFEGKQAEAIVILFLFRAQREHHRRLRTEKGKAYSLEQYMKDLLTDESQIAALRAGFEDAVRRLDFRAEWEKEGYEPADDLFLE